MRASSSPRRDGSSRAAPFSSCVRRSSPAATWGRWTSWWSRRSTTRIASRNRSWRSCCAPRATRVAPRSKRPSPPIPRTSPATSAPGSTAPESRSGTSFRRPAPKPAAPSAPAQGHGPGTNHIGVIVGKNVAVFVDVANIFYAAKSAGVDIDYVTLLKSATVGRDFVRAYAYTGLDPDNENQRNFHQFLARHQYKVVSKDIRKYGDGKVKANLDIELVVDLMKTARNLDVAVIVSGDGDFASAIRAVQEMGVRCEVISFRGNTSSHLIEVVDQFTDITQIAKVDKGSTRSGRRVAEDDDEDLSMTEVPDKMTEGTGRGRGRGRGRGGRYERDEAPVTGRSSRARPEVPAAAMGGAGLVALPGEKLSRAVASADDVEQPDELEDVAVIGDAEADGEGGGRGRGRRRRGRG